MPADHSDDQHAVDPNTALTLFCDATGAIAATDAHKFCELLHTRGFAIVRLPTCAHAEAAAVREAAGSFFAMDREQKRAVGDFRVVGDTYVGYRDTAATRQDCDAEFLEVHLDSTGRAFPEPPGCYVGPAAHALFVRLAGMARALLELLAAHIGVPPAADHVDRTARRPPPRALLGPRPPAGGCSLWLRPAVWAGAALPF